MSNLNRRDFLKALGVGSASSLAACGLDTNQYKTPVELLLPYVERPEQVTPGAPTFFATTVTSGPGARPVLARHRDGRVIFVGRNAQAPGRFGVGNADFFELQRHYSPDRIQQPKVGEQAATWEEATGRLVAAVEQARNAGKKVVYLGGYKNGAIVDLLREVTAGEAIFWEPVGYEAEATAAEALFGRRVVPYYGIDQAHYLLSFGAPFLSGQFGDADIEHRYAQARDPNVGHFVVRFALVAPYRDQTGANADDWHACRPGTEILVARAIAALVADRTGAPGALRALVGNVSPADAEAASGIPAAAIQAVAENLVAHQGLVLPGGASGSAELAAVTYLINLAIGAAPGRFHLGGYEGPIDGIDRLRALVADLNAGAVGVLLLDDANPVYALPDAFGFADAARRADLVVGLSSHPDETQALASLVLPASGSLEDWGDDQPLQGLRLLRQPAMSPLYDTRSLGAVLLAVGAPGRDVTAEVGGSGVAAPRLTWADYVRTWWQRNVLADAGDFQGAWEAAVVRGVHQSPLGDVTPTLAGGGFVPAGAGPVGEGDVVLVSYAHPHRGDGRYANQPWAQEISDPLTGNVWGSWLEVSKELGARLGLAYNDLVTVRTATGESVTVPVQISKTVRGNTAVLAFGQGHTAAAGRYAADKGVNAFKLYPLPQAGALGGGWTPLAVSLAKAGGKGDIVTTFSIYADSDQGRNFGVAVNAEALAAVGDAPSAHPGELTGIHHLQLDPRLREARIDGFYGTPDHPTYRFGMTVDTNACVGCWSCSIACYAENNLPVVGKDMVARGREMQWLRINRYWEEVDGHDDIRFVPMLCQHCGHAGCENVCPVLATYHNVDGLNAMVYNRCVGTRYCSNACPYSVRRFNYHTYAWPEPFNLQLNPDVVTREMGVMEKCTFCVQRLRATKAAWRSAEGFTAAVPDEAWRDVPACVEACPTNALVFGNLNDAEGHVSRSRTSGRTYQPLEELRTLSAINYLAKANFHVAAAGHHGGDHGGDGHHAPEPGHHGGAHGAGHEEG